MTQENKVEPVEPENESTGLPWPKSWNGAYLLVLTSFVIWVLLLIALTEFFA